MTLPTPPRYVVLPSEVIEQAYAPDKPRRALLASFTRILSLAWEAKYEKTPRLNEEELMEFLKLSRRQYFEQKADMELLGWLRSSHPVAGFVQFIFSRSIVASVTKQVESEPSAINRTGSAETRTGDIVVVVKESTDSELSIETTTPILNGEASAKNRTADNGEDQPFLPSVERILENTSLLFNGAVVMSKGLEDRDPRDVLRWCAYVYSQKHTMSAPGGVVRNKLKWNEKPPEWTANKWFETLPEPFLEAIGLKFPEADDEPQEEPVESMPLVPDESVNQRLNDGRTMSPAEAWQAVLGQLQIEMPRASFETWVRDAKAIRYDRNALTIGVANRYTAEWLESRLTSTVERLLIGILNAEVEVKFVVAELAEVESE